MEITTNAIFIFQKNYHLFNGWQMQGCSIICK